MGQRGKLMNNGVKIKKKNLALDHCASFPKCVKKQRLIATRPVTDLHFLEAEPNDPKLKNVLGLLLKKKNALGRFLKLKHYERHGKSVTG